MGRGDRMSLNATSQVITKTERVNKGVNVGTLVRDTALGTAAAAAIAAVTGDKAIATEELLIGGGAGVVGNLISTFLGRNSVDLVSIEPGTDLNLKLDSDLQISAR
jgi:hypothetical protein